MDLVKTQLIYFSATGTTKKIVEEIAERIENAIIERHNVMSLKR